jgi:hypothetical protein
MASGHGERLLSGHGSFPQAVNAAIGMSMQEAKKDARALDFRVTSATDSVHHHSDSE